MEVGSMTETRLRVWGTTLGITLAAGLIACSGDGSATAAAQTPDEYCAQASTATEKINQSDRAEPFEYAQQLMAEAEEALVNLQASDAISRDDLENAGLDSTVAFTAVITDAEDQAAADAAIETFYTEIETGPESEGQIEALVAHLSTECGIDVED